MPSGLLLPPPTLAQMDHSKSVGFISKSLFPWFLKVLFMGLALFAAVTFEDKVEAPSSDLFCISGCATCPVICSPPPPLLSITSSSPPPSPSAPHSPPPSYVTFSPPTPKSQSPPPPPHSSGAAPPPPLKPNNTPLSGSIQPQPTVISGPHDYYYPYYYFYTSGASSLSIHAPFFVLLLILAGYFSFVGKW